MRTNYQNIKFFNKEGYEIPLAKASNIVVKIYSNEINSERYATIMNGVYMEEVDEEGNYILNNFKILDVGSSFDSENISIDNTIIDLYIDGVLVDSSLYSVKDNSLDFEFESFKSAKTTTMNNDDEEYTKYGIISINNFSLIIEKSNTIDLIFPSYVFTGNIEMETVSVGLHSVETIYFGVEDNGELKSVDNEKYDLLFLTDVKDDDIQFFTFDESSEEIYKTHQAYIDLREVNTNNEDVSENFFSDAINIQKSIHTPQCVNFCCISNEEGVHQQIIYVMLVDRNDKSKQYKIGEFEVTVNIEGEDERFRALFANFGIPDPITYPTLFKSADIKEDNIDWELVNRKSKELFLSYDEIFPYVGTYKALINSVKFLGYDDVYFREWYRDIRKNISISKRIDINEEFKDEKNNISFDDILEDRLTKKKLNKLSLIYKLNQEIEDYDEGGLPILINTYKYSVDEVFLKLESLKKWLERYILSLNCRIVDITGEGVVYEKVPLKIYGTNMQNFEYEDCLTFTPKVREKVVKMEDEYANIDITVLNDSSDSYMTFNDFDENIGDYDFTISTIEYPYIYNMYVKAFVECENAKVREKESDKDETSGDLFINYGEILIDKGKSKFTFSDAPIIYIEKGDLKNISKNNFSDKTYKEWWDDKDYIIDKSTEEGYSYYIKDILNDRVYNSNEYICFLPINDSSKKSSLTYSVNNIKIDNAYYSALEAPVFILKDYLICTYSNEKNIVVGELNGEYMLNIIDGKIVLNINDNKTSFININYDEEIKEQNVKFNCQYEGYYDCEDLQIPYHSIKVNECGHYDIIVYAINKNGNVFAKKIEGGCDVIKNTPEIEFLLEDEIVENDKDFYIENSKGVNKEYEEITIDKLPIFEPIYLIHNATILKDTNEISYQNISFAYDTPKKGDYLQFMNIADKFYCDESGNFISFYKSENTFNNGDLVNIVYYDKKYLNGIFQTYGQFNGKEDNKLNISTLDIEELKNKYVYIFPISEHLIKDISVNYVSKETEIYLEDASIKYSVGEVVKLLYRIEDIEDIVKDVTHYKDLIDENLYPVLDESGNQIPYGDDFYSLIYDIEEDEKINVKVVMGATTFRIKKITNDSIILDGIYNYRDYNTDNEKIVKYSSSLSIAKANQLYVNYILKCNDDSIEYDNDENITVVPFEESRLIDFIDNTYTFIPISFDKNNAFEYWSNENASNSINLYSHYIPLTISKSKFIYIKDKNTRDNFTYKWRLYRRNLDNETRELLFEVVNDNLPLNISDEGIYDIEMDVFDIYGNKSHNCYNAILKVK